MEEKKVARDNQTTSNDTKDFYFTGDGFENSFDKNPKQYTRDFMLQLRLHPLSLQKPKNLPYMDFVKEKLYLNHIGSSNPVSEEKHNEMNYYHTPVKHDYCGMKHDYPMFPHYFSKTYPYCYSPHMYNGNYQSFPKFRPSFHTYCNTLKKNSLGGHSCYRDYPIDECIWAKRCYSSSDDVWNYPVPSHSTPFKKEDFEAVPKTKKKIPIIDPVTGKNVLDAVAKTSSEQDIDFNINESTESSENFNAGLSGGKYATDYFCNADSINETSRTSSEAYDDKFQNSTSEEKVYHELHTEDTTNHQNFLNASTSEDTSDTVIASGDKLPAENLEEKAFLHKDETGAAADHAAKTANGDKLSKNAQRVHDMYEAQKLYNKLTARAFQNNKGNVPSDVHGHCQNQFRKECNTYVCKENVKQNDYVTENLKQLREKIHSLRQEQQRMGIWKSFLRYKKFILDENVKNLDEKRIEVANWEYNLFNKAKLLQEKEHWLENKYEILNNKAQQLAEKEKMLNKEKRITDETQALRNNSAQMPKESQSSERKCTSDSHNDVVWEKICSQIKNYRNDETSDGEYSYFGFCPNQAKSAHNSPPTNVEKCQPDAYSLDELEKNIVMMEKMHAEEEENLENKTEPVSSFSAPKKEANECYEPIGYSKGRRYLPEQLKYWLNNRDKKAQN